MLLFYCRDCENTFESEPDGTGYEQAPCSTCGDICLTVAFEKEEQERHENEKSLFSLLGLFTGLLSNQEHDASNRTNRIDGEVTDEPPSIRDAVTVRSFAKLGEANVYRAQLEQLGIDAQLVQLEGTSAFAPGAADSVVLQVRSRDLERARSVIDEYESVKENQNSVCKDGGQITFDCEECGTEVTYSMRRKGGVEVCPHCGEYVDVPE
jgi:hypothetical protein